MKDSGVTVAIVTARRDEDTSYARWTSLRNAFLARRASWEGFDLEPMQKALGGEFGAVLTSCFGVDVHCHVEYQLRALALQTSHPDEVLVVTRQELDIPGPGGWPFRLNVTEPLISERELQDDPSLAAYLNTPPARTTKHSYGCSDKNTAIVMARNPFLVMLDDCCLPGPGLVEAVRETVCKDGSVLLLQHRQLYLPTKERPTVEFADSNTDLELGHIVFGVFAAPIKYLLDVNGCNVALDRQRGGLDAEMKLRMDRYLPMRGAKYVVHPAAKVYEFEHNYPWSMEGHSMDEWSQLVPSGYKAPGPDLAELRKVVQAALEKEDEDAEREEEEDEEFEFEGDD